MGTTSFYFILYKVKDTVHSGTSLERTLINLLQKKTKKKDKLLIVYPYFLLHRYSHNYSVASVVGSASASGASVASSAFLALPPRRLFAFLTSFLPPL
jgi:hypothetical protein